MKNLVLIGMMGCGKSTVGRLLAKKLGREFVDTDQYIEEKTGRTIPDLFAKEGEDHFRDLERAAGEALGGRQDLVIACGGGLPTRSAAIAPLKARGTVLFLRRDPAEIYDRVSMGGRPLGQEGRAAFLARYAAREPVYLSWADAVVDVGATPVETVKRILEVLKL